MVAKIKDYLATNETYFVIVGAGHLIGERGIINQLKKIHRVKQLQTE